MTLLGEKTEKAGRRVRAFEEEGKKGENPTPRYETPKKREGRENHYHPLLSRTKKPSQRQSKVTGGRGQTRKQGRERMVIPPLHSR